MGLPQVNFPGTKLWKSLEARKKLVELLKPAMTSYVETYSRLDHPPPSTMLSFYISERAKAGDPVDTEEELAVRALLSPLHLGKLGNRCVVTFPSFGEGPGLSEMKLLKQKRLALLALGSQKFR